MTFIPVVQPSRHPLGAVEVDLDLFADEVLLDTQPVADSLRELASVIHLPRNNLWAITRYDDVRAALANPEDFSSQWVAFNDTMNKIMQGTTIATDPPNHHDLRAVLTENLTPRALRGMRSRMEEAAQHHVQRVLTQERIECVEDVARDFVVSIVVDLIGIQGEQREMLLTWGEAALNAQGPMNARAEEGLPIAGGLYQWTRGVLVADDLREGSLGRAIFAAADRGDIPYENRSILIEQLIIAGMDTTITTIANALLLLGESPAQYSHLRQHPELIPSALSEVLRLKPAIPMVGRRVTRDLTIGDVTIPADSHAVLMLASGNRDPRQYVNPEQFDVTRNPVDQLSFGYGIHTCAGQGLARMEMQSILTAWINEVESFGVGEVQRKLSNITRPYASIELTTVIRA
ncbi:cytochrome P450 [Enteractinococcus helveticum]|uniref:Cytochrome n=1 Tax=Enteractinococcus helveticum TaxID=1837282 RepID=A0A1B7M150_9MICC|nr:cytochrome P450 [Enteractinococcus helveticum]OAV62151.1 cytochrome [Enteractinococcus helveticum]